MKSSVVASGVQRFGMSPEVDGRRWWICKQALNLTILNLTLNLTILKLTLYVNVIFLPLMDL